MSKTLTILGVAAAIVALPVGCALYSSYTSVATAPSRVINKTLGTNNILQNYELFHDENKQFEARIAQLTQAGADLAAEADPAERSRLRMETRAVQQSCRELAADYNANSIKQNRALFKDRGLPPVLDANRCEITPTKE